MNRACWKTSAEISLRIRTKNLSAPIEIFRQMFFKCQIHCYIKNSFSFVGYVLRFTIFYVKTLSVIKKRRVRLGVLYEILFFSRRLCAVLCYFNKRWYLFRKCCIKEPVGEKWNLRSPPLFSPLKSEIEILREFFLQVANEQTPENFQNPLFQILNL